LRPQLWPGVPLSRDGKAELLAGTRTVKQISGLRLLVRSASELQVLRPDVEPSAVSSPARRSPATARGASPSAAYRREVGARLGHATRAAIRGPEGILRTSVSGNESTPHQILGVRCPAGPGGLPARVGRTVPPRGVPSTLRTADDPASDFKPPHGYWRSHRGMVEPTSAPRRPPPTAPPPPKMSDQKAGL
jgi:hypothetical protein